MTGALITEAQFGDLLASLRLSAFRLETYDQYALDYEAAEFRLYLTGRAVPPPQVSWWRPWLDRMAEFARQGKTVRRVRILAEPPTDYQRWMLWSTPWHAEVGEHIGYIPRSRATRIGLPLEYDWWLLDDERLIVMRFTDAGEINSKELVTDPETVAQHLEWRDLAVHNTTPAVQVSAA